ncbi:catalytic protein [Rutstroemia sp. NJR-2017a BVV2]|nr:catalytic protein [Rutstroemia sp. NJR-2017a BVV2]
MAHVHNLLTIALVETHVVHTKIYPRYKSRKAINFARDDFSTWLQPHEDASTDVILLGHSMGGILSAEVVLQPSLSANRPFKHRILGTINFDTPFLGMHPGVVISGIGSLFRPAPDPPGLREGSSSPMGQSSPSLNSLAATSSHGVPLADSDTMSQRSDSLSTNSLASPPLNDPHYNPPFPNDVRMPDRKGIDNLLHFINKHAEGVSTRAKLNGLTSATSNYFMSHLEFGGCLADYPGMMNRYSKLRSLEDANGFAGSTEAGDGGERRRFVNYYTASTGRLKKPKASTSPEEKSEGVPEAGLSSLSLDTPRDDPPIVLPNESTQELNNGPENLESVLHVEEQIHNLGEDSGVQDSAPNSPEMQHIDSIPIDEDEIEINAISSSAEMAVDSETVVQQVPSEVPLPPLPEAPTEPPPIDLSLYTDKDARKIAEKEQKRLLKSYNQALKDRESALKDRQKLIEKREKKARQEEEKQLKAREKQRLKDEKEEEKRLKIQEKQRLKEEREEEVRNATANSQSDQGTKDKGKAEKPKKDKKFCMLPPESGGKRDTCWVRVYMEGVDEVGAHCGLFFPGPQYESLVGNVGERIETWVKEDATRRRGQPVS